MSDLTNPLNRAKQPLSIWIDKLPEAMRLDASMALDDLLQVATQEIRAAYFAGYNTYRASKKADELSEVQP